MKDFLSIKQTAAKWNISERRIQKLCTEGRVEGATKIGKSWIIPHGLKKPEDKRKKNWKKYSSYHSEYRIKDAIYGEDIRILSKSDNNTVYFEENKTGTGIITHYKIYPGIDVFYNDIHMEESFNKDEEPLSNIMEINHCKEGRFEGEFQAGGYLSLSKGDLAINLLSHKFKPSLSYFPLSHYHGISIVFDIPIAIKTLNNISNTLGNLNIDLDEIRKKTNIDNDVFVIRTADAIEHIFCELYNAPDNFKEGFLKVKILELLVFLSTTDIPSFGNRKQYLNKKQVEIAKKIKLYLTDNLDKHITLSSISKKFNISLTSMKNNFKIYFGTPISTYIREYRLQIAAKLLQNTDKNIAEIAEVIGYENPAKFTVAFQKLMHITPSEYRKNFRLIR